MQTILITGSTRGIGKGLAREFLRLGHRVIVTGRSDAAVTDATRDLSPLGDVLGVVCDVRQLTSVQAARAAGVARFGRIDIWINNAAVATDRVLLADLPAGGKVFTFEGFGSDGLSRPGLSVYGATKRAIRYLTASLAKECAGTNVLVGSLSPGIVATDLLLYSSKGQAALASTKQGARIAWMTLAKAAGRFASSFFRKRDVLSELEARTNLTVR